MAEDQQERMSVADATNPSLVQSVLMRRNAVKHQLLDVVRVSVTSASVEGRTVRDPAKAAEYVVNALTEHHAGLLALAAVTFAADEVRDRIAERTV